MGSIKSGFNKTDENKASTQPCLYLRPNVAVLGQSQQHQNNYGYQIVASFG